MKTIIRNRERKNKELALELSKQIKLSPMIIEYLCDHGYKNIEDINKFLNFNEKDFRKVSQMKDGMKFMKRLVSAIKNKEKIVIWGDYDGDGICATAIFMWTLRWLGIDAGWFISNRFTEGYGMSIKGMERLIKEHPGVNLIVTCDNGIVAFDSVEYAKEHGIDVIISDHHEANPEGKLPACPVVCEKRLDEDRSIMEGFCGAELVRRICCNLVYMLKRDDLYSKLDMLYGFAGFATVTDVIDFNPSNHYLVKRGLEKINQGVFPCFKALKNVLNLTKDVDEDTIGFKYGPMVNAAGRILGEATIPLQLFIEQDENKALELANKLLELNEKRQEMSLEEQKNVVKEIEEHSYDKDAFIIVSEYSYEEGIAGLNASYIVDNYKVPAICFCQKEGDSTMLKGSGRSVEDFNLKLALDQCADLLAGYGGHPMAAGITIKKENLEVFRVKMNQLAKNIETSELTVDIDYLMKPSEVSNELAEQYKSVLAPFGPTLEKPVYALCGVFRDNPRIMKEKHLKSQLSDGEGLIDILWFNSTLKYKKKRPDNKRVIVTGQPSENEFNGTVNLQFIVDDLFVV